ncbi:DUF2203 domain-containing protein [Natronoglycomyces albus]|uniref:DUF2203 domain-containing protein n=1 Tax=Natronoglycomyces albus TaxID=2811108 RepID=A0A895XLY2_9ACTN|nr:DUF2203 domain-containing protein [Natronoglycomyces albus]QSB06691.1 DUF2203 domain-containing protein [Natronoglycomyces albus]
MSEKPGNDDGAHELNGAGIDGIENENLEPKFTLEEARRLMPLVREKAAQIVKLRGDLAELAHAIHTGADEAEGGLAEVKALEAHLNEAVAWFPEHGIDVKGVAPLLIDFPSTLEGRSVQLCWLEGERELRWYHRSELGFVGRRPLGE